MKLFRIFLAICLIFSQVTMADMEVSGNRDSVIYKLDPVVEAAVDSLANPMIAGILADANGQPFWDRDGEFALFERTLRAMIAQKSAEEVNAILDLALAKVYLSEAGPLLVKNDKFRQQIEKDIQKRITKASNGSKWKRIGSGALIGAAIGVVAIVGMMYAERNYRPTAKLQPNEMLQIFLYFAAAGGLIGYGVHGIVSINNEDVATVDLLKDIQKNPELESMLKSLTQKRN